MSKAKTLRLYLSIGFTSVTCLVMSELASGQPLDVGDIRGPDPETFIPSLTINGSFGPVTINPLVMTVPSRFRDALSGAGMGVGPIEGLFATAAWDVSENINYPQPHVTLHVTERPLTSLCYHDLAPGFDLSPSREMVSGGGSGNIGLNFRSTDIRPGRTYFVQGCVWKNTGGNGIPTNIVPVSVGWDTPTRPPNLYVASVRNGVDSADLISGSWGPGPSMATSIIARIFIRHLGEYDAALLHSVPDRFLIDVYVNDDPEPIASRVLSGVKEQLAAGIGHGYPGMELVIKHPVPITADTHKIMYVINADGSVPESNYEDNGYAARFGYRMSEYRANPALCAWHLPHLIPQEPFAIRRIWSDESEQGDAYAWVNVELSQFDSCALRSIWNSGGDPNGLPEHTYPTFGKPVVRLEIDEGILCIGGDDKTVGSQPVVESPHSPSGLVDSHVRRFFCYNAGGRHPFTSSTATATLIWGGVDSQRTASLEKSWRSRLNNPDAHLPNLIASIEDIDFVRQRPVRNSTAVPELNCGYQPMVRIQVVNQGAQASSPTTGYVTLVAPRNISHPYIDPVCSGFRRVPHVDAPLEYNHTYFDIPALEPGESHSFEETWQSGVGVQYDGMVRLVIDPAEIVVEHSAIANGNWDHKGIHR